MKMKTEEIDKYLNRLIAGEFEESDPTLNKLTDQYREYKKAFEAQQKNVATLQAMLSNAEAELMRLEGKTNAVVDLLRSFYEDHLNNAEKGEQEHLRPVPDEPAETAEASAD